MRTGGREKIYSVKTFTKISGFRRVVTCRSCGKRALIEKESCYCNECAAKLGTYPVKQKAYSI